ncbi:MAG: sigma-54-dependent transcriptional regulator [Rhodospirillales bacterium]
MTIEAKAGGVLLFDDEDHLREACTQALELADIAVVGFARADGELDRLGPAWPGVVVSDIRMPGIDGMAVLEAAQAADPDLPVILVTGHGDVPLAVQAMRKGAYDFIEKPFASEVLVDAVRRALEKRRLVLENRALRSVLDGADGLEARLVGRSPAMVRLRDTVRNFAATEADVLIFGETGAGKEVVARALHDESPRAEGRFVAVNCGALPDHLIESELFGHEAGAFTGAEKKRIGLIEHADGGTLFLDEIESMPLALQTKLLRVLQGRAVVRLGANVETPIDIRVLAATKEDLRKLADTGKFREDLYYRLNVLTLTIPPLRERGGDIPLLFQHFVARAAERFKRQAPKPSAARLAELAGHDWPGNVRELENAALRFALGAEEPVAEDASPLVGPDLASQMDAFERQVIERTFEASGNSMKRTYEALGISRKTLYDKMRRLGIKETGTDDDG